MSPFDNPDGLKKLLGILSDLLIDFMKKQIKMIGDALVLPGHGFAASREFSGLGMSDDVMMMLSGQQFIEFEAPCLAKVGEPFGGAVFHSCGDWSGKIEAVKRIENLVMVDAAFSKQTDPNPNPPEPFAEGFAGTGIVVNARASKRSCQSTYKRQRKEFRSQMSQFFCHRKKDIKSNENKKAKQPAHRRKMGDSP